MSAWETRLRLRHRDALGARPGLTRIARQGARFQRTGPIEASAAGPRGYSLRLVSLGCPQGSAEARAPFSPGRRKQRPEERLVRRHLPFTVAPAWPSRPLCSRHDLLDAFHEVRGTIAKHVCDPQTGSVGRASRTKLIRGPVRRVSSSRSISSPRAPNPCSSVSRSSSAKSLAATSMHHCCRDRGGITSAGRLRSSGRSGRLLGVAGRSRASTCRSNIATTKAQRCWCRRTMRRPAVRRTAMAAGAARAVRSDRRERSTDQSRRRQSRLRPTSNHRRRRRRLLRRCRRRTAPRRLPTATALALAL